MEYHDEPWVGFGGEAMLSMCIDRDWFLIGWGSNAGVSRLSDTGFWSDWEAMRRKLMNVLGILTNRCWSSIGRGDNAEVFDNP